MSLTALTPYAQAFVASTQSTYQRANISVEEENRRLRQRVADQGGLIFRHQDAILQDIIDQIRSLIQQDPHLQKEVAALLEGKTATKGTLLNTLSCTLSTQISKDTDLKEFVMVDPHRNLRILLHDFHILAQQQVVMPSLEEKIDIDAILQDLNEGGTSKLYYIGRGMWVTGQALFQVTYQLYRITSFTVSLIGVAVYNPIIRATVFVAVRVLTGG